MANKFIRCFMYGLEANDEITVSVFGKDIVFSPASAQIDIDMPEPEPEPAPVPATSHRR